MKKTVDPFFTLVFCAALLGLPGVTHAVVKTIELPPDGAVWQPSTLPGYAKVMQNCVACHSAEYAQSQPPTASRAYYDAMVHRMKAVFNAPIDDADMPAIVDYLVKTYGAEKPAGASSK
ncbi:MAG: cytochrome c [Rhodoferax sp.]|nr:cytochrome c [Rhodoferax sp.]